MSNSYRIRTKVGVDESINILIDQEFEYLEILSLKLLQSQIYTRQCSDYGVIVGRVSVNNGFGIPNAKVSVFIPLDSTDETDPVISELYPYKTLTDLNDEGYRYNLLPYKASHGGHIPTGTFFERTDVLIDPTLIEVYDKYYKYTTITNSSGDYMIFGVPVGSQTIVMDVDLSDIGEFSLSPQDLIRMGVATSNQVAGTKFKSSTNLRELPQLITLNKTIDVSPLWGEPGLCNLGITRTDFDLANESNINIRPTAIFMGSIFSTNKSDLLKSNCKPKGGLGDLCSLVAGPGEILAIRQTIQQDIYGRPILESVELDEGGQVIDENGTWLLDVPMNMDYVITNEFGEQVISDDPEKGLPTKGKYRFKIKWNQSPSLSETIRRGYFLVPNIREHGWNIGSDPLSTIDITSDYTDYQLAMKSYSFSLDWSDYGYTGVTSSSQANYGKQMIQDAIDCKDTFYELKYNKVYTVSQMIDQYRNGFMNNRFIGVKNILNDVCDSDNNKFPTNDTFYRFDIIYILFTLMMFIVVPILFTLISVVHVLYAALWVIGGYLVGDGVYNGYLAGYAGVKAIGALAQWTPNWALAGQYGIEAVKYLAYGVVVGGLGVLILDYVKKLPKVKFPLLTYPDCETCECEGLDDVPNGNAFNKNNAAAGVNTTPPPNRTGSGVIAQLFSGQKTLSKNGSLLQIPINYIFKGAVVDAEYPTPDSPIPIITQNLDTLGNPDDYFFTSSLTLPERINLFNTKAKYFDDTNNPGGGVNRVKVSFNPISNPNKFHYDNVIVIICSPESATGMTSGSLYTFQNPTNSFDINTTLLQDKNIYRNNAITGSSLNNTTISVSCSNFNGVGMQPAVSYTIPTPNSADTSYHKFPIDLEYFQVITGMTYSTFKSLNGGTLPNSLKSRYLDNNMTIYQINNLPTNCSVLIPLTPLNTKPIESLTKYDDLSVIIMNRGVDPYSSKMTVEYDLSRIFGYNTYGNVKVSGNYKLNIPINGGFKNVRHNLSFNTSPDTNGNQLYFNSFNYKPGSQFSGFSSNMVSYYSMLDSDNVSFKPGCSNPLDLNTFSNDSPQGLKVKNYNDFTKEGILKPYYIYNGLLPFPYQQYICDYVVLTGNTSPTKNRGYFENEIIEGGSLMALKANLSIPGSSPPSETAVYFSPKYPSTLSPTYNVGSSLHQIVMRSDRLPTSTTLTENCGNSFLLQSNENFTLFAIPSGGTINQSFGTDLIGGGSLSAGVDMKEENKNFTNKLIDSSTCTGSVPLKCYKYDDVSKSLKVNKGDCERNYLGERIFEGGCYITVTVPIFSLPPDLLLITEWSSRLNINFGACRNVWSHIFTNNWINGSLFAFAFKNNVSYSTQNKPVNGFCSDTIVFHRNTNNFYYRSSPYNDTNKQFNGRYMGSVDNDSNLLYPTTIMDLGPRNTYMQEIVMSDDFDGYVMNKLDSTTYGDVSEILNLFILSRLANQSFLEQLLAGTNILEYFSRYELSLNKGITIKGDADYSQMISINSELGVAPFESMNYPDPLPGNQSPIYINPGDIKPGFGIFFSSDTSIRDFITPKRTIIESTLQISDTCAFSNINVYSQTVPFYQWKIDGQVSIFGSEMNDWDSTLTNTGFFNRNYQEMDRLLPSSKYFRTNSTLVTQYYKGYIYSVNATGGLNSDYTSWSQNSPIPYDITVGAPFHFYFGLKRGKSAYDRFLTKWVDTTNIID